MPRKAATAESGEAAAPRRSSRIKEQPKEEPAPKKAPAKPRAKKADKETTDKEDKPKSTKGTKRKTTEDTNGTAEGEEVPPAKKVFFRVNSLSNLSLRLQFILPDKARLQGR